MTDYLTGCTHFGHSNILKLASRPFNSVEEMNEVLIENWNSTVNKNDTVYHLGDFSYKGGNTLQYSRKLNGNIIYLQGNHDFKNWGQNYLELNINKVKVVLMHYPIEEWNGWFRPSIHLHCHTHKREFISGERRGNVGVDACNFTPIKISECIERLM